MQCLDDAPEVIKDVGSTPALLTCVTCFPTVKMIAGRIIPAVATATASVTGLVMMEFFKILQVGKKTQLNVGNRFWCD